MEKVSRVDLRERLCRYCGREFSTYFIKGNQRVDHFKTAETLYITENGRQEE